MSRQEILTEAAEFIESECDIISYSYRNVRTGEIDDTEMREQFKRGKFLAEKLRQYAKEI